MMGGVNLGQAERARRANGRMARQCELRREDELAACLQAFSGPVAAGRWSVLQLLAPVAGA